MNPFSTFGGPLPFYASLGRYKGRMMTARFLTFGYYFFYKILVFILSLEYTISEKQGKVPWKSVATVIAVIVGMPGFS